MGINCNELIYIEFIHVFQASYPLTDILTRFPGLPDVVVARLSPGGGRLIDGEVVYKCLNFCFFNVGLQDLRVLIRERR